MLNIVLFGPPGSGKGTQAVKLVEKYNLVHLSTGDIFRANIKGGTELGNLAKSYMDRGALVPDEVTISMLEDAVNKNEGAKGFIFDGFPRNTNQAEALDKFLLSKNAGITLMLSLEVDDEELKRRIIGRGLVSGRTDDQDPAIVENRIAVYNKETAPVADYYASQMKFYGVDGMLEIEDVFESLCFAISIATGEKGSRSKKAAAPKKAAADPKKKAVKKAAKKSAPAKKAPAPKKKAVKKSAAKKSAPKKAAAKKSAAPKTRKITKKAAAKKTIAKLVKKFVKQAGKKTAKKTAPKKAAKKVAPKKATKKTAPKKVVKKAAPKKINVAAKKKAAQKPVKKGVTANGRKANGARANSKKNNGSKKKKK